MGHSGRRPSRRRERSCTLAAALVAAVVLCAKASAQEPTAPSDSAHPEVVSVTFPGAASVPHSVLRQAIATHQTSCKTRLAAPLCMIGGIDAVEERHYLERSEVPKDAERIAIVYEAWGFPEARVDADVVRKGPDAAAVRFHVDEGEPILVDTVVVEGRDSLSPALELPRRLPLRAGLPYALPRVEATEKALKEALASRGRPNASVEIGGDVDAGAHRARVVFRLRPGPAARFGPVSVRSQAPLDERTVRQLLAYRQGDSYDPALMDRTEVRLYDLSIVSRAVVEALPGDTVVPTRIVVDTRRSTGLATSASLTSTDCLGLMGEWRDRWLLGGPRELNVDAGVSNLFARGLGGSFPCSSAGSGPYADPDYVVRAGVNQPWPGPSPGDITASAWYARQSAPDAFVQRGWGARVGAGHRVGLGAYAAARYTFQRNTLDAADLYYCGNYGVCDGPGIAALAGPTRLAPVELLARWHQPPDPDVERDRERTAPAWYRGPYQDWRLDASAAVEVADAATGSDYRFGRAMAEGSATRFLGESIQLGGHARVGSLFGASSVLPPNARLFSGGPSTVRGVPENLLGPTVLVVPAGEADALGCAPEAGGCPADVAVDPERVALRALGGDRLLEANLEARYALGPKFSLAAFLDYGRLDVAPDGQRLAGVSGASVLTPGVGFRILADVGQIRLDVGYDPRGPQRLPLLAAGADGVVPLGTVTYDPFGWDGAGPFHRFLRRLQVQVAMGQAF